MKNEINEVYKNLNHQDKQHFDAIKNPTKYEKSILNLLDSIKQYAYHFENETTNEIKNDYLITEYLEGLCSNFIGLLSYDLGRLSAGKLSYSINEFMEKYDLEY